MLKHASTSREKENSCTLHCLGSLHNSPPTVCWQSIFILNTIYTGIYYIYTNTFCSCWAINLYTFNPGGALKHWCNQKLWASYRNSLPSSIQEIGLKGPENQSLCPKSIKRQIPGELKVYLAFGDPILQDAPELWRFGATAIAVCIAGIWWDVTFCLLRCAVVLVWHTQHQLLVPEPQGGVL